MRSVLFDRSVINRLPAVSSSPDPLDPDTDTSEADELCSVGWSRECTGVPSARFEFRDAGE